MLSSSPFRRSARAFTLIELLTVIAIVGILASLVIPTVAKVRFAARNTQCTSNLREWGRVVLLYAADHRGSYTFKDWASIASDGPYRPYIGQTSTEAYRFRVCPLMSADQIQAGTLTYAMTRGAVDGNITKLIAGSPLVPLTRARNPSQYLLLCDAMPNSNVALTGAISSVNTLVGPLLDSTLSATADENIAQRHGGRAINGVFADGSTRRITGTPAGSGDRNSIYEMRTTWLQLY